jgi:DnaJ like chaperone protein
MFAVMSLWSRLSEIVSRLPVTGALGGAFDRVIEAVRSTVSPVERRQVAFTVSMIALSAKMAKADGVVTSDEVSVVKRLFVVPDREKANVARLFNLAKQDVAGFEAYASRIEALNRENPEMLEDVLDGLFVIAGADGLVHERELSFLEHVADIFHVSTAAFGRIMARHVRPEASDPYVVLGIPRSASPEEVKRAWRRQVSENHPDRLIARGLPAECVRLATDRVAALNAAYERIERELA